MRAFTNLAFANTEADVFANGAHGIHPLLKLEDVL
jgi:hypothetical protein